MDDDELAEPESEELRQIKQQRTQALAEVVQFGDPVLRSVASPVVDFDAALIELAGRMAGLMLDALGIGMAAPQLGVPRRLLVFQCSPDQPAAALVNPTIEWASREQEIFEEGCLSLDRITVDVERPRFVRVRGCDLTREPVLIEASGLEARVLQHEIDHLDGLLILDRTSKAQRRGAMRALREGTSYHPDPPESEDEVAEDGADEPAPDAAHVAHEPAHELAHEPAAESA